MTDKLFSKESELCAAFIGSVENLSDWTCYPETGNWDILMVRDDGFQIGIEAKLRLNGHVICQAIEGDGYYYGTKSGPDCRAVLVPSESCQNHLASIARYIGITVIAMDDNKFRPELPDETKWNFFSCDWFERAPLTRIKLPDYVPIVEAGHPCPIRLTHWKISAIKLAILLDKRGFLTRTNFKHFKISPTRWTQGYINDVWLRKGGHRGRWVRGPNLPDFRSQHPENYAEIEADFETWNPDRLSDDLLAGAV